MSRSFWTVALGAWLLVACDDALLAAFEPQALGQGGAGAENLGGEGGGGSGGDVSGSGAAAPSSPLMDDFEDGDPRAVVPRGWWYPINDETSRQGFGIEPVSPGNPSAYALRTHGSAFRDWGAAVGVDLTGNSKPSDASSYAKLCFFARVESDSNTAMQVHLIRGGQHYLQDTSLSETWTTYCLPLADFIGPDSTPLVPDQLIALQFFFAPQSPFALWLDDVEFTR